MAASNSFINNNNQNTNFRIGLNTRDMTPNDISNAMYNANYISSSDVNAVLSNENAPAEWSAGLTDLSSANLIQNPKRSLESIIEERKQAIERKVIEQTFGDQFERLKAELTAFVNGIVGSSAKLFATDSQPDSFMEAASLNSEFGSAAPELDDAVADLSARLMSLCSDRSAFDNFKGQLVYLLDSYKTVGRELKKAESTLRAKLEEFDKLKSDVSILLRAGDGGDEFMALQEAYLTYVKKRYSGTDLDESYKSCLNLHKKWALLRDLVLSVRIAGSGCGGAPTCGICLEDPISHALANCGHTFCSSCLRQIGRTCPNCRKAIHNPAIKIFFT